jgi:hypothetical protein
MANPKKNFDKWLKRSGYDKASEMYPGAFQAVSLVDEYFEEYPEREQQRDAVEQYAEEIGWISDYVEDEEDPDD